MKISLRVLTQRFRGLGRMISRLNEQGASAVLPRFGRHVIPEGPCLQKQGLAGSWRISLSCYLKYMVVENKRSKTQSRFCSHRMIQLEGEVISCNVWKPVTVSSPTCKVNRGLTAEQTRRVTGICPATTGSVPLYALTLRPSLRRVSQSCGSFLPRPTDPSTPGRLYSAVTRSRSTGTNRLATLRPNAPGESRARRGMRS